MYVFVSGPPTAGKSHLVNEFITQSDYDILHIKLDDLREDLKNDPNMNKWVNFFRNLDPTKYWQKNTPEDHIKNIIMQARALWPEILIKMKQKMHSDKQIIFEGVSVIPELASKFLDFPGFYLVPTDVETIYNRLLAHSRWGKTNDLKRKEAIAFYEEGKKLFGDNAREYGYKVFTDSDEAALELSKIFNV
ncbi:MAG: hypothetical protein Q8P20_02375 [bacterium]|nr:hypothetical protein [bacterium]